MRYLLVFVLLGFNFLFSQVLEIKDIDNLTDFVSKDTLVIFDLDNTLIETSQSLGSDQWFDYSLQEIKKNNSNFKKAFEKMLLDYFAILHVTRMNLVEKNIPSIINKLQKNNYVMGLTGRSLELSFCTKMQLQKHDIDFSKKSVSHKNLYFVINEEKDALFKHGILFCGGCDKGICLFSVFSKINYKPKKIVFIDDKEQNLLAVKKYCEKEKIPFLGLRYNKLDKKVGDFKKEITDLQLDDLKKIISDSDAEKALNFIN